MLYPSDDLRKGRRRLEEIEEISIIDDLTWDELYNCFFIHFSIELDQDYSFINKKTEWYVTIDPSYPFGEISIYPSCSNGLTCTFPHQLNNSHIANNNLWRLGKLCVDFGFNSLGTQSPEKEATSIEGRLFWHMKRAVLWLYSAAKSELVSPGDSYELPDYSPTHSSIFAYNEDVVSMMVWEDTECTFGTAKIFQERLESLQTILYVQEFASINVKEKIYLPPWGKILCENPQKTKSDALWIKLSSPPIVNHWQGPTTLGELIDACTSQGVDFLDILQKFAPKARDGRSHLILFGFPIPKHYGEVPSEMVWQALELPPLSNGKYTNSKFQSGKKKRPIIRNHGVPPGYRPSETGWWLNDTTNILIPELQLVWIDSQNWGTRTISSRGHFSNNILSKNIAVIGAGSLGSAVSELLVRSGVTKLTCIDGDFLEIGNLCRHTLTMRDLNQFKSVALAKRLSEINPNTRIVALSNFLTLNETHHLVPDLSEYDIVIDTTGNDRVLDMLVLGLPWEKTIFLSTAVGLGAKHIYLCLSRNRAPNFDVFLSHIEPYFDADREACNMLDLPRDGIGCWHPSFPARADDMWMAATTSIKTLESFLSCPDTKSLYAIYGATTEDNLCCGYAPIEVKYNAL